MLWLDTKGEKVHVENMCIPYWYDDTYTYVVILFCVDLGQLLVVSWLDTYIITTTASNPAALSVAVVIEATAAPNAGRCLHAVSNTYTNRKELHNNNAAHFSEVVIIRIRNLHYEYCYE